MLTVTDARHLFPRSAADAMDLAQRLYNNGNDAGNGFPPDLDTDERTGEYIDMILPRCTSNDVDVVLDGERIIAVGGDARGGEPWAVDITDALRAVE